MHVCIATFLHCTTSDAFSILYIYLPMRHSHTLTHTHVNASERKKAQTSSISSRLNVHSYYHIPDATMRSYRTFQGFKQNQSNANISIFISHICFQYASQMKMHYQFISFATYAQNEGEKTNLMNHTCAYKNKTHPNRFKHFTAIFTTTCIICIFLRRFLWPNFEIGRRCISKNSRKKSRGRVYQFCEHFSVTHLKFEPYSICVC